MRDILFRGKRLDNGEWIEGDLRHGGYYLNDPDIYIVVCFADTVINYLVDPDTVGQYTGLKDKNGKRIFEGDMLYSIYTRKNYPVVFGEYGFDDDYGVEERSCGWFNKEDNGYESPIGRTEDWAVIVGNIHDNPELLEV